MARILLGIFVFLHWSASLAAEVKVGVREDAEPFSYRDSAGKPAGYMVALCEFAIEEVRKEREIEIEFVYVKAEGRFDDLRSGKIDLLCDPATITEDRLSGLSVYGPVYLSGVSYAVVEGKGRFPGAPYCGPVVGMVSGTTTEAVGLRKILEEGEVIRFHDVILQGLSANFGEIDCPEIESERQTPIKLYPDHDSLLKDFCSAKVLYYVGDIEIIAKKMRKSSNCDHRIAPRTFTDERYAIFGNIGKEIEENSFAVAKIFEAISRVSNNPKSPAMIRAFEKTFQGDEMSNKLKVFFWSVTGTVGSQ